MKGMFWITKGGDVVESLGAAYQAVTTRSGTAYLADHKVIVVKRVSSGAFLGTRRLDKLRPATAAEVATARERGMTNR